MSKINDQYQLNQYEQESADETEIHPGRTKSSVFVLGDEKRSDNSSDEHQIFQSPESDEKNSLKTIPIARSVTLLPVLNSGSGIFGTLHSDHHKGHKEKEQGHGETQTIDRQIADSGPAINFERIGHEEGGVTRRAVAERHFL